MPKPENNYDSSKEWDINNINLPEEYNVFEEVDFSEESHSDNSGLDSVLNSVSNSQDFQLSYEDEEESTLSEFFKKKKAKKYIVKKAKNLQTSLDKKGFRVLTANLLIHKSTRDLWKLTQDDKGQYLIEKLFEEEEPLDDTY